MGDMGEDGDVGAQGLNPLKQKVIFLFQKF